MPLNPDRGWIVTTTVRSQLMLEAISAMVGVREWPEKQAKIHLRQQGPNPWRFCLFASDTGAVIPEVARREVDIASINPAFPLTMALRGTGPFNEPVPLRMITVIPSPDRYVFAVLNSTGLTSLADLRDKHYPLRVGVRNQPDHADFLLMDEVFARYGFALRGIEAWGGQVREYPWPPPVRAVLSGEIDAVFDEGVDVWADQLLDADMRMLPLDEEVVQDLERIGLRRGVIPKADFPRLEQDILSLDFSGWPVFTHADVPDELITAFCAGLEARKETIPWHGLGPLPLERMCQDQDGTPIDIPFHRAAERYWREQGYQPTSAAR